MSASAVNVLDEIRDMPDEREDLRRHDRKYIVRSMRALSRIDTDAGRGLRVNGPPPHSIGGIAGSGELVAGNLSSGRRVRPFGEAHASGFACGVVHRDEIAIARAVAAFKEWLLDEAGSTALEPVRRAPPTRSRRSCLDRSNGARL